MASVLTPTPNFHVPGAAFGPEVLLDRSWLGNRLPWQALSKTAEEANAVDYEHVASPMQEEIIHSGSPQWCQLMLGLPTSCTATISKIEATWRTLSTHHPCLRTVLYARPQDGRNYHRVMKWVSSIRKIPDHTHPQASEGEQEPKDQIAYLTICKQDGQSLMVTLHIRRALVDVTSLGALKFDFALLYCGLPLRNTTPMTKYIDHIAESSKVQQALDFWRTTLEGGSIACVAPKASVLQPSSSDENQSVSLALDAYTLRQLSRLESNGICSRKCFFESLWALVLSHHAGTQDVIFAVAERDRSFEGYATCVGGLDQIYPMRVRLSEEQSLISLTNYVDAYHNKASPHGHLGHSSILETSKLPSAESLLRYSCTLAYPCLAGAITNFPLIMFINDYDPIKLTLFHSQDIDAEDAELLLQHYVNAIRDALDKSPNPDLTIENIDLGSEAERRSIIDGAAPTKAAQVDGQSHIATWFEAQVESHPSEPAIQFEYDDVVTFDELNRLSNRIARAIQISKQTFVPLCMDRSVDLIACLFAILKSGAAYVILDPEGASQRNLRIVEDCEATIVLTNRRYASNFKQSCIVEHLERIRERNHNPLDHSNLQRDLHPDDPCYVIYTSGSTGAPKGVVLTHRAATSGIAYLSLNGRHRWLLFYNPIFSAAQRTMIATLVRGCCLLLASKESLTTSLAKTIDGMKADALGITPSALSLLSPADVPTLKQITLVGEQVSPTVLGTWCDHVELRNTFGLSECTQLNFGSRLHAHGNPRVVGRPSDTTRAFILRPGSMDLAPLETAGELCLTGPQLGRGYLKKPEQTAKAFVVNPFGPGKLYRTGDGARQHRNGDIEIIGRLDFQIKINGQRAEPTEIDEALLKHPNVQTCATVAATMGETKSLVAAIVSNREGEFSELVADLRRHVEKLLPSYMIPSYWLPQAQLPRNANGKIDIPGIRSEAERLGSQRLLELSQSQKIDERPFLDEKEIAVRNVWARILQLNIQSVHHHDSFIALGGGSLQAITAVTQLRQSGLAVELAHIIGSATLDEIAASSFRITPDVSEDFKPFTMIEEVTARQRFETDVGASDAYPVTPLQESLLAASLGGNGGYVYQRTWDMAGFELPKLKSAMQAVFERSDILRTTFVPHGKSYLQIVKNNMKLPWKTSSSRLAQYKKSAPAIHIASGQPLFDVALVQERYLVVSMHHSLFDFWSHRFLYQDVAALYFGETPVERPPFKRFVKNLLDADHHAMDDFWKSYLAGAGRTIINHAPSDQQITVEKTLDINFKEKSQALGITTGSVLYAAWALVLSRHTGTHDVSFATTLSGRETPIPAIDRLDGPTLTTVPQRIAADPTSTALDFAKTVNSGLFRLMKFAQHGMRRALSAAGQSADYFDTLVNVLVKDQDDELSRKLFKRQGPKPTWSSEYATLEMEELDRGFQLRLSSTIEPRRAEFLLVSVTRAIESILGNPTGEVGLIDIMGPQERAFLATKDDIEDVQPHLALLHSRFELFAHTDPDKVAIDWDSSKTVTYRDLNKQADKIAAFLSHHDIGRGDVVPLYLDKSIETIVAIIGTMKAGAAYVPLSPENPLERNLYIVEDVVGQIILTQSDYQDVWQNQDLQVVNVANVLSCKDVLAAPSINQSPDDIAYVIYTSGSTGNPKGVKVPHRSASAAVTSMLQAEGRMNGEWRTLQFANYVFDASVQDIFNTLSSGGTLCMAPTEKLLSDLAGTANKMNVKQAIVTPTVAKLIEPKEVPGLETLIVGGEQLTSDVVEKWAPSRTLLNVYGPTETSMVVSTKKVLPDDNPHNIGKPHPTTSIFIMNQDGTDLVPYGAVGELCISGPQLSKGYVNNDTATNASFSDCERLGINRMYKTGDLARWYPDGNIECLGRKDKQIKIHGHRIELGEVEQAIVRTHAVHDTVVVASEVNQKPQLSAVAVFEPTERMEFDAPGTHRDEIGKVKEGLNSLPPYMIPKSVVPVGKLPKLPSGKVDRKLLKKYIEEMSAVDLNKYSIEKAGSVCEIVPVATEEESDLEQMWSEILGQDRSNIGAHGNFFSLGGDSVSAINLVSACRTAGYGLSVSHVLKSPILREMALKLKKADASKAGDTEKQFTTPDWLVDQLKSHGISLSDDVDYTYPTPPGQVEFLNQGQRPDQYWVMMNVRPLAGSTSIEKWTEAVTELTRINDILRTFWTKDDTTAEWIGVVLKEPCVEISRYECTDMEHRSKIIESIWDERFGFGKPWIRYAILTQPDGKRDILTKMDHAVYDGTLLRILAAQFAAIQKGIRPPAHEDFQNFALHMWRSDKAESTEFWKTLMSGSAFIYPVAHDPKITALVSKPTDVHLDNFAARCSVTPSIVFQTAFQLWLMRTSKCQDVSFDYLLSGRNVDLPSPQSINGNLANILPFRSRLTAADDNNNNNNNDDDAPRPTLGDYLAETQRLFWEVTENGNLGLSAIYAAAQVPRTEYGNRALFLFQPFEAAVAPPAPDEMRWVVMKGAEVRMFQPYALVVEISKTLDGGHLVKVMFDEEVLSEGDAEGVAGGLVGIVEEMVGVGAEAGVGEFLN